MWCNFEQSCVEDETISNAFSSRGIFKVSSEGEVKTYPKVLANVQNKKMVLSIDKSLVLLEDELVARCSFLSFNSEIDVMTISDSGNLIICALKDGEIHGIYIKGIPLFNVVIKAEDVNASGRTFAGIQQIGSKFFIVCCNGSIYSLSEIDETPLENNLNVSIPENETVNYGKTLLDAVQIHRLFVARNVKDLNTALIIASSTNEEQLVLAFTNNSVIFNLSANESTKLNLPSHYGGVKKAYNLENYILILTHSGHLLKLCSMTQTLSYSSSQKDDNLIDDMIVLECNEENIELLVLTKTSSETDRQMKFMEYPSFKCPNYLDVPEDSWLVQQPKSSVNLYYLSGHNNDAGKFPNEIEMLLVSETHPSERFKKLIARGHLEEAEVFGIQFELSLQPIYEAKAKRIIIDLSTMSENNPELLENRFSELLELLEKIENPNFFRRHRMINIPSRVYLEKYLKEMLKHFDEENDEEDIYEIIEQLHRLKTLAIIDPYECDSNWQKFVYHKNLIKMITSLFKTDISKACLIWKRHSSALIPRLNEKELRLLLTLIPTNTEAFYLIQWLRQFVPTIASTHPGIMPYITEWSIQKTRELQYSKHWPEIGLEFSTKVTEIFDDIKFIHSDVCRQHERNVAKLHDLVNALQDLSVLKKTYNLSLTLDNYLQDSMESTALCILQHVHLDNLQSLVRDFLYPIFQENGKTPVAAVRRYITFLVSNRNSLSTWLQRAVACIELLHCENDRLETALLVLQNSPVPWPKVVAPLVKLRTSTHPLAVEINVEYDMQVIKIMKVKYGWPSHGASDMKLELFVLRIIKMDLPDMLDDIRTLIKAQPDIAQKAYYHCFFQMAKRGKIDEAYEFFKILNGENDAKLANDVTSFIADYLENSVSLLDDKSTEEEQNIIDFYKLLTLHSSPSEKKRYLAIQNRFLLRHKFHLTINRVSDLVSMENRIKYFDIALESIIERSQSCTNVTKFLSYETKDLCTALNFNQAYGILRLCRRMKVLVLSCALTFIFLEKYECDDEMKNDFIELALELIVQTIQSSKRTKNRSSFLIENDPLAFPLIYTLLTSASMCPQNNIFDLTELIQYVHLAYTNYPHKAIESYYSGREKELNELICKAMDQADIPFADSTLNFSSIINNSFDAPPKETKKRYSVSIFDKIDIQQQEPTNKKSVNKQLHISNFVARTLLLMVIESEPRNEYLSKLKNLLPDEIKTDTDDAYEEFFLSLEFLIKSKTHDVWYIMAQYLLKYQTQNNSKNIITSDFISSQLKRVFKDHLLNKDVNFIDLYVMLICDKHASSLLKHLSNDIKTEQQRINLLRLAEMYNSYTQQLTNVEALRIKRIKHYYYMEFCKQDPSIKGKFNADFDNIETLLKEFQNKQLDVKLLEQMSRDFDFDYQKILITQVLSILESQELQYTIKTDAHEEDELVVLTTVESIRKLCEPYLNEITNIDLLTSKLKVFIDEINLYFYELYLCVIELLLFYDAALKEMLIWTSILHFLKHKMVKRRRNRPGQLETDIWLQSQKEIGVLPKIARYRLPFKPLVELPLKDILDGELNVNNCQSWVPLIQMHTVLKGSQDIGQSGDYFRMTAVKNSIAEYRASNESQTWHLQPTNNAFLQAVLRLVKHFHSPSKAFLILYFVSNYAPEGADQVEAAYECYKYAIENESLLADQKCYEQVSKIKRKYPILKTQHLLHVYNLAEERIVRLIENPEDLIFQLYHHEIILKSTSKLDINVVAKEIANLHGLDIGEIQYKLLHKFLSFTLEAVDGTVCDETFFEDQTLAENSMDDSLSATENVIRANYILNSWPKKEAVQFLVAHIFSGTGTKNISKQLQMCECLLKMNDGSNSFDSLLSQEQYIAIKCVYELKKLGYNFSVEKFADKSCNKIEILKTIWQRNAQNPFSLEVMANICLGFEIYVPKIWNGILKRMVMSNMVQELNSLVEILSSKPQFLHTEGLVVAWNHVLKQPFQNANQTRSFEQEELLKKTLFRFQGCPVLHSLPLKKFAEMCIRLDRPHMAAIIMALCQNEEERQEIAKMILSKKTDKLKKEILDLEEAGILPVVSNLALKELGFS